MLKSTSKIKLAWAGFKLTSSSFWTTALTVALSSQLGTVCSLYLFPVHERFLQQHKALYTFVILCLQLTSWRVLYQRQIQANHNWTSSCMDCYGFMTYTWMTIPTYKIACVNSCQLLAYWWGQCFDSISELSSRD